MPAQGRSSSGRSSFRFVRIGAGIAGVRLAKETECCGFYCGSEDWSGVDSASEARWRLKARQISELLQ